MSAGHLRDGYTVRRTGSSAYEYDIEDESSNNFALVELAGDHILGMHVITLDGCVPKAVLVEALDWIEQDRAEESANV